MKRFHLIKHADHVQIAHLYEHLFCDAVYEYFRQQKLYAYLDYDLNARTYYSGMVELRLALFSQEAQQAADGIRSLEPAMTKDAINGSLIQILAEHRADIRTLDTSIVLSKLAMYQKTPWRDYDDLVVENAADHSRRHKGLTFKRRSDKQFLILRQDIELDREFGNGNKRLYWPGFFALCSFLTLNLQDILVNGTFCYSFDTFGSYTNRGAKESNLYRVDKRQSTKLGDEIDMTKEFITEILGNGTFERFAQSIRSADSSQLGMAPNPDGLYRSTAMLVGGKGWQSIGTDKNLRDVLKHTSFSFRLGSSRGCFKVADLLG